MRTTAVEDNLRYKRNIDIDLSHRCPILCPMCWRQSDPVAKAAGHDMSMEDFMKVVKFLRAGPIKGYLYLAGALSDPIHHPQFIDFLHVCRKYNIDCEVQTASSYKSKEWFIEAFKAHPNARWQFGIDGLPEDSHKYRINQDGVKLFEIMEMSTQYLNQPPIWQYIIFKYNQKHVKYCESWAWEIGASFKVVLSGKATDFDHQEKGFRDYVPTDKRFIVKRNEDKMIKQFETFMEPLKDVANKRSAT